MTAFPPGCRARFTPAHALPHGRWLAFESSANRPVVIRLVVHPRLREHGAASRFAAEQVARSALVHPHLVPVLAHGVEGDTAWVATAHRPCVEGLAEPRNAVGLARALQVAHDAGLLHRDLAPHNILAGALTDFGLARWDGAPLDALHTAPEVLAGGPPTPRADTYALGRLLAALDLPRRFDELVERACASEPGARWPSAAALADALEDLTCRSG